MGAFRQPEYEQTSLLCADLCSMPLLSFILCVNEVAWGTPGQEKMQRKEAGEWILVESKGVERLTQKKRVKFIRGVGGLSKISKKAKMQCHKAGAGGSK